MKFDNILLSPVKIRQNLKNMMQRLEKSQKSKMVQKKKCKARKMLKNAALVAKIGVDTAENEPRKGSKKCML
jgi:hypothetical protein